VDPEYHRDLDSERFLDLVVKALLYSVGRRPLLLIAGALVFGAVLTFNSGGYRYGVTDQAFYIPVVLDEIVPNLFPLDSELIDAQDRFFVLDDWFAWIIHLTGFSLPVVFLCAYLLTLVLLYMAIVGIGQTIYRTGWAVSGLVFLMTVRHRIPRTAVNSVEGYFHPRMLAFAVGLCGVALFLRGRTRWAFVVVLAALLAHPTTGVWFIILVAGAAAVSDRAPTRQLLLWTVAALTAGAWALAYPLRSQLAVMDDTWIEVLSIKDYLVIAGWPLAAWVSNLAIAGFVFVLYWYRRVLGVASHREGGLVAGCGLLVGLFLLSAPFSRGLVALAVQLQFNRIFWLVEVVGVVYLGWLLFESPFPKFSYHVASLHMRPRRTVVAIVALLALTRGGYRVFVERAGQPIIQVDLAHNEWNGIMRWASDQPIGTHFLAHPTHSARYGTSVRAASGRDVYLELIKDTGIAIYSSDLAHRVDQRVRNLGDFENLTVDHVRILADSYAIDFLITEQRLDLPIAHATDRFVVYELK
jgi:hypothetical protein